MAAKRSGAPARPSGLIAIAAAVALAAGGAGNAYAAGTGIAAAAEKAGPGGTVGADAGNVSSVKVSGRSIPEWEFSRGPGNDWQQKAGPYDPEALELAAELAPDGNGGFDGTKVRASSDGSYTVTLLQDLSLPGYIYVCNPYGRPGYGGASAVRLTLDLDGHTVTTDDETMLYVEEGDLVITGDGVMKSAATGRNGTGICTTGGLIIESGTFIQNEGNTGTFAAAYGGGRLEVRGGRLEGAESSGRAAVQAGFGKDRAELIVSGGEIVSHNAGAPAVAVMSGHASITGGTIRGGSIGVIACGPEASVHAAGTARVSGSPSFAAEDGGRISAIGSGAAFEKWNEADGADGADTPGAPSGTAEAGIGPSSGPSVINKEPGDVLIVISTGDGAGTPAAATASEPEPEGTPLASPDNAGPAAMRTAPEREAAIGPDTEATASDAGRSTDEEALSKASAMAREMLAEGSCGTPAEAGAREALWGALGRAESLLSGGSAGGEETAEALLKLEDAMGAYAEARDMPDGNGIPEGPEAAMGMPETILAYKDADGDAV